MLNTPIPSDLCAVHREMFRQYRENHYSPWKPPEWPGGSHIKDCRVSHKEREADWDRKNLQMMEGIAETCRSGWSPQCGDAVVPEVA
ncbi:hypothetical protein [Streptomyces sp. HC307]|uniref:hypothetical protein n=1 Tax=Streptomyces flavusporus TaxID=3385496 RepID=UPI0039173915